MLVSSVTGVGGLVLLNILAPLTNILISVNILTIWVTALLGLPGLITLTVLKLLFAV